MIDFERTTELSAEGNAKPRISTWSFEELVTAFKTLSISGGPLPEQYPLVEAAMDRISELRRVGAISELQNDQLWAAVGKASTSKSVMGLCYRAPYGYRGDFEIIDRLYTGCVNPDPEVRLWDEYSQALDCAHAVRNRSEYVAKLIHTAVAKTQPLAVLNVGSGPCRDLLNFFNDSSASVHVTCVELDSRAIEYASALLDSYQHRVTFVQKNVLRLSYRDEFNLVWSSGLFDYLDDRQFILALKKMTRAAKPGGEIVIGNFAPGHASRSSIEWANWFLNHRTEDELLALAVAAGISRSDCRVAAEQKGVNLFLHINKKRETLGGNE